MLAKNRACFRTILMSKFHSGPFSHRGFREMATRPVSLKFGAQAVDLTMQPAIERGCLMATICCFIQQEQSKTLQETVQNSEHLEKTIQSLDEMRRNGETVNKVEACHDCISRKNFYGSLQESRTSEPRRESRHAFRPDPLERGVSHGCYFWCAYSI